MDESMDIQQAILHILDKNLGAPVFSESLLNVDGEIAQYIEKHINRALRDEEMKEVEILLDEVTDPMVASICRSGQGEEEFIELSRQVAESFYGFVNNYEIPSADLLIVNCHLEACRYFVILKMNYKKGYIHFVESGEERRNSIITQPVCLPAESQKIDEFIIFDYTNEKILIKERKYDIDGQKECYISKRIIKAMKVRSDKEKLNLVKNTVKKVIEKYYPDDITAELGANESISSSFNQEQSVDIGKLAETVSRGIESIREEFVNEMKATGLEEEKVELNENLDKRINKKHRIVTEDGVELKLPMDIFKRKDKFEILNNPDGTLSIMIKNVEIV